MQHTQTLEDNLLFFFHNLNYAAVVETIPTCYNEANPKKYPTVIAGEHLFKKNAVANTGVKKY